MNFDTLKYKVFIKEYNMIFDVDAIDFRRKIVDISLHGETLQEVAMLVKHNGKNFIPFQYRFEEVEIIQCIGAKDKNGTLIFNGDVVECEFSDIGKQKAIVYWSEKYASFLRRPIDNWAFCSWEDCVVIGNIYENTEYNIEEGFYG